ncbi:MAG: hypothetical protein U0165_15135 [Polyangiaceae bacterium]
MSRVRLVAVALSVLLHAVIAAAVMHRARQTDSYAESPDVWAGQTKPGELGDDLSSALSADIELSESPSQRTIPVTNQAEPASTAAVSAAADLTTSTTTGVSTASTSNEATLKVAPVSPSVDVPAPARSAPSSKRPAPSASSQPNVPAPPTASASPDVPTTGSSRPSSAHPATSANGSKGGVASGGSSSSASGGSFGTEANAMARDLPRAFTRASKDAGHGDKTWGEIGPGHTLKIEVDIEVDSEGKIAGSKPHTASPPPVLIELVRRTIALLRYGVFALKADALAAGSIRLRIVATTSEVDPSSVSGGTSSMSYEYNSGHGAARFTQVSGRHVELVIDVLNVAR